MEDPRRDPEALLRRIKAKERQASRSRGKLKVFLGANAGVGKTFRMLSQAKLAKADGIDVVVGLVETHGRKETGALLEGLEIVPRREIDYRGAKFPEMDIDAILTRKPKLVLVDELAHTNVPGARHNKRYQDVEELLDAGIDVYATLNIQHIESLNDTVFQITGVKINETVPDRILEMADEPDALELVDLSPAELEKRLKEGKVYIAPQAKQAIERFFRRGNLLALREMALRYTARLVDQDMRSYMEAHSIAGPWPVTSRIAVCIGSTELSQEVLRLAKQLSPGPDSEWFAVHVESPLGSRLSQKAQDQLAKNLKLAESLGGKIVTLTGHSLAYEILAFARRENISLVLVGWRPRIGWRRLFQGSLVNTLVKRSGSIHVMVVTSSDEIAPELAAPKLPKVANWSGLLKSFLSVLAAAGFCWLTEPWLHLVNIETILLLPVIAAGILWGKQAGIFAAVLSLIALNFFSLSSRFSWMFSHISFLLSFTIFLLVGFFASTLAENLRRQRENARHSERIVSSLYDLSRELLSLDDVQALLQKCAEFFSRAFGCETQFLLPDGMGRLQVRAQSGPTENVTAHEMVVADWAFNHGRPAGRGTETLSSGRLLYLPLKTPSQTVGVIAIGQAAPPAPDEIKHFESFANIIAVALARTLRLR